VRTRCILSGLAGGSDDPAASYTYTVGGGLPEILKEPQKTFAPEAGGNKKKMVQTPLRHYYWDRWNKTAHERARRRTNRPLGSLNMWVHHTPSNGAI
jgi:hypothetical protein